MKLNYLRAGIAATASDRAEYQTFLAGGTITKGQWVAFDNSKTAANKTLYVVAADVVANGNPRVVGVAMHAASAGGKVKVCIAGYCAVASVTTGVAADALLCIDTTIGRADTYTAADLAGPVGVCLTLAASHVSDVIVKRQF